VEVNLQTGCQSKVIQNPFEPNHGSSCPFGEYQGVVSVLQDWARQSAIQRVGQGVDNVCLLDQALQNIGRNNEQVWRDRIALPEPAFAVNPPSWNAVQEHRCFSGVQNSANPTAPVSIEPSGTKNQV